MMGLNRFIDHTLLSPNVMDVAFESMIQEAVDNNFYSVCVSPHIAEFVVAGLFDYPSIKVGTVVSFPHGNLPSKLKLDQAKFHIDSGVDEIDWVINIGEVYNEHWDLIEKELVTMSTLCKANKVVGKCIVEAGAVAHPKLLEKLFYLVRDTGTEFIKTSSGFNGPGAQLAHVKLWNELRGSDKYPKIKASGGIKTAEAALAFLNAGANRLGMSASVQVMEEYKSLGK